MTATATVQPAPKKEIGLSFGALSPAISKQLDEQKFKYGKKKIEQFEREIDAIQTLRFGSGLLTDGMYDKIIKKLYGKIVSHVAQQNGFKVNKK